LVKLMAGFSGVQLAALLVSSSVLAALVSLAGNHLLAQLQFKRDYFREIVANRLSAYQQIDELIGILRMTTYDDSGRIAHVVFLNKAIYDRATLIAAAAVGLSLYVSEPIRENLSKIDFILLKLPHNASESEAFDVGVAEREVLSGIRQSLFGLALATGDDDVAFVKLQPNESRHSALRIRRFVHSEDALFAGCYA